jgi:formamidopyrimidine-DNA glycosylase
MEQESISGVGNYIKSEVLYECQINPFALVSDLDDQTLIHLHHSIRTIAQEAYKGRGASLYSYTGTRREKGSFQAMLKVYGKSMDPEGQNVVIIPEKQSPDKRTTHYVPTKQTIGNHRDPLNRPPTKKIVITIKVKH